MLDIFDIFLILPILCGIGCAIAGYYNKLDDMGQSLKAIRGFFIGMIGFLVSTCISIILFALYNNLLK